MSDEAENTPESPAVAPTPEESPRPPRVLLLGSGELGRELVFAFQQLGAEVIAVDGHAEAPAHRVADESWVVELTDPDTLAAAVERIRPHYVVAATEAVAADALAAAEHGDAEVVPSARSARLTLDREGLRRLAADELGLPTVPFWFAGSVEELAAIADHAGFPLVVKPLVAVPGEGQSVLLRAGDIEPAWQRAIANPLLGGRFNHNRVLAETVVEIDYEVTLLTVRTSGPGGVHFCEPIGHRQVAGVLEAWQPQQMSETALDAAKSIAARIIGALGGRGVFGVELLVHGDEVYFSDVTSVPPHSALVTLRSQRLSQFELHARATLGLALDTMMISPGAAEVIYGEAGSDREDLVKVLTSALEVPETDVRVFAVSAGASGTARRRLGLALATAPDVATARDRVRLAGTALRGIVAVVIESRDAERDGADGASAVPFMAALAIIVLVVIGIGLASFSKRGDDGERESVVRAALAQNDALQRLDYLDFRASTCTQQAGSEAEILGRQRDSSASKGARYVDNVTGMTIDGQQATATVVYYFANDKDAKIESATTFVLQDGSWRVCSPGPI